MSFFQELQKFIRNILHWIYVLIGFSFFFFLFPTSKSLSVLFFEKIKSDLLPRGVQIIATNPMSAFLAQMLISIILAFIVLFPFLLYRIINYLSPALYEKEQTAFIKIIIPASLLFIAGCFFSYYFIIPPTYKILYSFTISMAVVPFFSVGEFVSSVMMLTVAMGIMFLLPIFMFLLSWLGLIESGFWKRNWRYAIFSFLLFSAIITPDGTGITMVMMTAPLIALYGLGMIISKR